MARGVLLRQGDRLVWLPVWPSDVSMNLRGWATTDLDRPGRSPLTVQTGQVPDDIQMGYTARAVDVAALQTGGPVDFRASVQRHLDDLQALSVSRKPCQVVMRDRVLGLFRMEPPSVTVTDWAADGSPSVADVSLTLKRASDASVNVGLVKIRGKGRGMARRT